MQVIHIVMFLVYEVQVAEIYEFSAPVGTLDATFERKVTTIERMTMPPLLSIREYGSTADQNCAGAPVLLKASTVMNIPEKKTRIE